MPDMGAPEFVEVDGLRIRYVRGAGADGAIPVLLMSPFPESLYAFDDIWADLARAAPLVAVDLPGFGQSEGRAELMTSQAMGSFAIRILGALGLSRVHAVGPDVGTSALLFAASESPQLFESLIVGSGGTDVARTGSLKEIIFADSTDSFAAIDGADYAVAVLNNRSSRPPGAYVMDDYRASYAGSRVVEAMAYLRAYPTYLPLLQKLLPRIDVPVLSIWGAHDPIVLADSAQVLDEALPRTRSLVFDSGHFVWHDRPAEYATALLEWIDHGYRSF
jgi:pimeloyl-ACP methyl ester carboxylesterase